MRGVERGVIGPGEPCGVMALQWERVSKCILVPQIWCVKDLLGKELVTHSSTWNWATLHYATGCAMSEAENNLGCPFPMEELETIR